VGAGQFVADAVQNFGHDFAAIAARGFERLGQHLVATWMQVFEGQIVQFAVNAVQTNAIGDGSVDFQRFARNAFLLVRPHHIHRAHIVQAVGQFDQHHPQILGHGEQHFAEVFRLGDFLALEFQLVDFGHAIDQFGDGFSKFLNDFQLGDATVFHDIMQ